MKTPILVALAGLILIPSAVFAAHKLYVKDQIIEPTDRGIYEAHEPNCSYRHYHGELNGVADPAPEGCGHGEVKSIPHGDGDGETIPVPKKSAWESFTTWVSSWWSDNKETVKNVVDVAAEANGIPPPGTVSDTVDIVKDAAPSIKEKIDVIEEYRQTAPAGEDTLGLYNKPSSGGNADGSDTLSQKFFKWLDSLTN